MTAPTTDLRRADGTRTESDEHRRLRLRVGASLLAMGIAHVAVPKPFVDMVPRRLGAPRLWNLVAAGAETAAGILLLSEDADRQRIGGAVATATIAGVYPANISMALRAGPPTTPKAAAIWLRLPMQFPMIAAAWRLAQGEGTSS